MSILDKIGIWVILIGGGLAFAADYFGLPWLAPLAIIAVGIWVVALGVSVMISGQIRLVNREARRYEYFAGVPARLWSVVLSLFGGLIIWFGWIDFSRPGGLDAFWEQFLVSNFAWGIVLGLAGIFVSAVGIIRILSGAAAAPGQAGRLENLGFRVGGVFSTLAGGIMILVAIGLIFAPDLLKALFDGLKGIVTRLLLGSS